MTINIENEFDKIFSSLDKIELELKSRIEAMGNRTKKRKGELMRLNYELTEIKKASGILLNVSDDHLYLENKTDSEKLKYHTEYLFLTTGERKNNG